MDPTTSFFAGQLHKLEAAALVEPLTRIVADARVGNAPTAAALRGLHALGPILRDVIAEHFVRTVSALLRHTTTSYEVKVAALGLVMECPEKFACCARSVYRLFPDELAISSLHALSPYEDVVRFPGLFVSLREAIRHGSRSAVLFLASLVASQDACSLAREVDAHKTLVVVLRDDDAEQREAAARALARMACFFPLKEVAAVQILLDDSSVRVQEAAVAALAVANPPITPASVLSLVRLLDQGTAEARHHAAFVLRTLPKKRLVARTLGMRWRFLKPSRTAIALELSARLAEEDGLRKVPPQRRQTI